MNNLFPKDFTKQTEEIETLTEFQGLQFPKIEGEDDAIRQAYLAIISSSSPSSYFSSRGQIQENLTRDHQLTTRNTTAFTRFRSTNYASIGARTTNCRQGMLKRSITFFKNLYMMNRQEGIQVNRAMSTQVHHMISERRRREKLNENFQHLRSLLPPGTKKDKASVLASTIEYLSSLKYQVEELCKRNEILEGLLLSKKKASQFQQNGSGKVDVYITNIEERSIVDLQVITRGKCSISDLVICLMEFLKLANYVNLVSIDANTTMVQSCPLTLITLRLRIQGDEWDESAFLGETRRVVGNVT
ncbi:putative transcription factor bHLH041 [Solanum dulcamara]|uniref:putative transcription factor bHLH041 n=1 Tax=Solanum dulcamara TaxID=45834 RepID=UPI002484E1D1|nr:putative transcription factor bHLH041 [Solanum dulcamara]